MMRAGLILLAGVLTAGIAPAADTSSQTFANDAGAAGMAEVQAAHLALQQSKDAAVKRFAKMMIKDHTAANAKLKTLAKEDKLTMPAQPTAAQQAVYADLKGKTGQDFDRAYAAQMVKDHQQAVALFRAAESNDQLSANLRGFAKKTLPTLEHHLKAAQELNDKLGG